jgi:hypothetical protein
MVDSMAAGNSGFLQDLGYWYFELEEAQKKISA